MVCVGDAGVGVHESVEDRFKFEDGADNEHDKDATLSHSF